MIQHNNIDSLIQDVLPTVTEFRHLLHQFPETACKEFETAKRIREFLSNTQIAFQDPCLETDVVGLLQGTEGGPNITLRADIDALPLEEKTRLPYQSKNPGCMHACGHDGHTAMLAGAALVLDKSLADLNGSVRFVFQPGEEVVGAGKDLVKAGILESPRPAMIVALHAWPDTPLGSIGTMPGAMMAAADFFKITLSGQGCHGCAPHTGQDVILASSQIIQAVLTVPSRQIDPLESSVASICSVHGGTNANILPDQVVIEGTLRYHNTATGNKLRESIRKIVAGVSEASGIDFEFDCKSPYIPTINHPEAVGFAKEIVTESMPDCKWVDVEKPSMGAEDFSFYLDGRKGAMFRLGMGLEGSPLHSPQFDFDDRALRNGILFLVQCAIQSLG